MGRTAIVLACTATLALAGYQFGYATHGLTLMGIVPENQTRRLSSSCGLCTFASRTISLNAGRFRAELISAAASDGRECSLRFLPPNSLILLLHRLPNILGARDALLDAGVLGHVYRVFGWRERGVMEPGMDLCHLRAK